MSFEVCIASGNRSKVAEFLKLVQAVRPDVIARLSLIAPPGTPPEIVEDGADYRANALKKARGFFNAVGGPVLSDDSGLEVDALDGAPGLHSARFGGAGLSAPEKNLLLLKTLSSFPKPWTARFRCVLCYLDGSGEPRFFEGVSEGEIREATPGAHGFGYDPVFYSYDLRQTFSVAPGEAKARVSHRGRAMGLWIKFIESTLPVA